VAGSDLTFQEVIAIEIAATLPAVRSGTQPPADGTFPYIQFGESVVSDTFPAGETVHVEIHVWSTAEGPHEVKNLQATIKGVLHKCAHTRGDFLFTAVRQETARTFLDVDNETWHGVQRFRALASNIAA